MTWQANLSLKSNKKLRLPSPFMCLIDCLFAWAFTSNLRIFHSYGDVTITGEGLQFFNFTRPLTSEDWLMCHTYCDTGQPFIMVISDRGLVTLISVAKSLALKLSLPVWKTGDRTPISRVRGEHSTTMPPQRSYNVWMYEKRVLVWIKAIESVLICPVV